jgi:capsular exopolysaccharide synthesis family protein
LPDHPEIPGSAPGRPPEERRPPPPRPEQIWPPPDPAKPPSAPDEGSVELSWTDEVGKIDEAIEEIRRINGGRPEELEPEEDELIIPSVESSTGELVAGVASPTEAPAFAASSPSKRRVRPQSENELGQLWGNVFFSVDRPAPRVVVVTGARRGDGATQISTSLALLGAEANAELRIALVDFNLRDPAVADLLGIPREPGLTDVLNGRVRLEAAMHALTLKNGNKLHVLPCGPRADHPLGLLRSRQVRALIGQLRDRYDHVLLDAANVNNHPDPQVLGAQVDGALLVIRAGETPRETVAEAKKRLDLAGVRCLGLVMNQRTDPIPSFLYRMT